MIRVLFDHQAFLIQGIGGISRYFANLMQTFSSGNAVKPFHSAILSRNVYGPMLPSPRPLRLLKSRSISGYIDSFAAQCIIALGNMDVFHPTYYGSEGLSFSQKLPMVLTIYDMIHELFPELIKNDTATIPNKKAAALAANRIIAISQTTKNDIVRILGISPDKIDVVHLATSFSEKTASACLPFISGSYILYVGTRSSHKNFDSLIRALALMDKARRPKLVCAGGGVLTTNESRGLKELGLIQEVAVIPDVNDSELAALYCNARAFVFPSRYEGFGLPILEAFACNCPVIAAQAGSIPEIAADAALYFGPDDIQGIADCIDRITHDNDVAKKLKLAGTIRNADFSWQKTAEQTHETYKRAMCNKQNRSKRMAF